MANSRSIISYIHLTVDNRMALLAMGTKVPVHFENQVITASVANLGTLIDAAKIKSRNDFVYALIKVVNTEDDQVNITLPLSCAGINVI